MVNLNNSFRSDDLVTVSSGSSATSEDESTLPTPRPQRRSAARANGRSLDDSDEDSEDNIRPIKGKHVLLPQPTDPNVHAPGAIVRIKMKNFVTYAEAEFKCGPSLNMIIGPNGTGKSTLVCAICLGLGWPPSCLGRAKDIGDFVKNGCREGEIEIELKGTTTRNILIHRTIVRKGNKTAFRIDGKDARLKDVKELMHKLNIQIDNLCQFLPQDKVVEFAGMTPIQLLEQTQRAAAEEIMSEWHEKLKTIGSDRKARLDRQEGLASNLAEMKSRQNLQQKEVNDMKEREELEKSKALLIRAKPMFQLERHKAIAGKVKEQAKSKIAELTNLQLQSEPLLKRVREKQQYASVVAAEQKSHDEQFNFLKRRVNDSSRQIREKKDLLENCDNDIDTFNKQKEKMAEVAQNIQRKLQTLERQAEEETPDFDPAAWNMKIRDVESKITVEMTKKSDADEDVRRIAKEAGNKTVELNSKTAELAQLETQEGQQKQKLARASRDSARAWEMIQKKQAEGRFKTVYPPPIISCSVSNQAMTKALESTIKKSEAICFTVTDQREFVELNNFIYSKDQQNLHDVAIKKVDAERPWTRFPRSSEDELHQLGFQGYLIDALSGPEPVLTMLCEGSALHRTAYTENQSESQFEAAKTGGVNSWVTSKTHYTVSYRREYSDKAMVVSTELRATGIWGSQSIDRGTEFEMKDSVRQLEQEIKVLKAQGAECDNARATSSSEISRLRKEKELLEAEKKKLQVMMSTLQAIPREIERCRNRLSENEQQKQELVSQIEERQQQKYDHILRRANLVIAHATTLGSLQTKFKDSLDAQLRLIEAQSDTAFLEEENKEITKRIRDREEEVDQLVNQVEALRMRGLQLLKTAKTISKSLDNEEKGILREFTEQCEDDDCVDKLEAEIMSLEQRLELAASANPLLLAEFEQRGVNMRQAEEALQNLQEYIAQCDEEIKTIRENWEPRLEILIGQISEAFSHNMEQIGCAGQVDIWKEEDNYSQWAIQIHVKFRETEPMSILDKHRQSGGERAVSTIFYLMALQSLARSPFRVVDEINQGMDPRNERNVHERMVDIACSENTSQYFLITPKLLSNLKYHERMVVHAIYSSESMPSDAQLDLPRLADLALRVKRKAR